ncbi:MAG TPA: SPOR domain-containing protein [Bacteroidia bacterium]|nr:SPOR domain-containing protein [Bacteroidia bacterium]
MLRAIIFSTCILFCCSAFAQKLSSVAENDSALIITRDPKLVELIDKQKQENLEKQSMPGYRIQIYFGGNRQKAAEIKVEFSSRYPEVSAYLTYQQPNYKVRVGDYRSRFEAKKLLSELEGQFPTTFVVPDDVRLPPLK